MSKDIEDPITSNTCHPGASKQHTQVTKVELFNKVKPDHPTHCLKPQEAGFT